MGIVCEFYIVPDEIIDEFLSKPAEFESYFEDNYENSFGQFHKEEKNMFYCDKAWDVARYLFQQNSGELGDLLGEKIENAEMKSYIKTFRVKEIDEILKQISIQQIQQTYDNLKTPNEFVYNSGKFIDSKNWEYISGHIKTFYKVFKTAAENDVGIIISRG